MWVVDKVINMSLLVSLLKIAAPPVTGVHNIFWMKKKTNCFKVERTNNAKCPQDPILV
jgi:hypothetical protein